MSEKVLLKIICLFEPLYIDQQLNPDQGTVKILG